MFKTIVWATDGSETAARALPYALGLAEPDQAKLIVVHAREIFVGRGGAYPFSPMRAGSGKRSAARSRTCKAAGSTRPSSFARAAQARPHTRSRRSPRRSKQT